ncbi:MAG: type II 3-dehydroquinate dehydratase, partial [Gemmatimonadota bacterium]
MNIAIVHGPNLQLLGLREPEVYGNETLEMVDRDLEGLADELGVALETFQSNHEGDIIDFIVDAAG